MRRRATSPALNLDDHGEVRPAAGSRLFSPRFSVTHRVTILAMRSANIRDTKMPMPLRGHGVGAVALRTGGYLSAVPHSPLAA